jgi:hypothetical protein
MYTMGWADYVGSKREIAIAIDTHASSVTTKFIMKQVLINSEIALMINAHWDAIMMLIEMG